MKKYLLFTVIIAIFFSLNCFATDVSTSGGGGGGGTSAQEKPDSLRSAQVFAGADQMSWKGDFWFTRHVKGEQDTYVHGEFIMDSIFQVTYLKIDDMIIVSNDDKPWPGLPANAVGETRDFFLNMSGYAELSDMPNYPNIWGSFSTTMLLAKQAIIVRLVPQQWYKHIDFTVPEGISSYDVFIENEDGAKWGYDYFSNGFTVYLDPRITYNLKIKDSNGIIYTTMVIDPLADNDTNIFNGNIVNVSYPDGLTKVSFENEWVEFKNQKLNGKVGDTPTHVYILNQEDVGVGFCFYNIENAEVKTYLWQKKGEMREFEIPRDGCQPGTNYCNSSIPQGEGKIIITITGELANPNGFMVNFQKLNY